MESDIDRYRAGLDGQTLELVDVVRKIIAASHPGLTEEVKWNAPSFAIGGEDRITLGLERQGGVRVVLHRGAKPLPLDGFNFVDETEIARWPAPDRGIVTFRDRQDFELRAARFSRLCVQWIASNG